MSKRANHNKTPFSALERKAVFGLAGIFASRMFGLFVVLPVFRALSGDLDGATPQLIGLALGIYGGAQALLQIPFGMASDRFGRKRVILFGLLLFFVGSLVAALSENIVWIIVGRALQGAGAISSAVMALAADLTRDEQRTKAMAVIGMSIGAVFALSLVIGPLVANIAGLSGVFWLTAAMAVVAALILVFVVPSPVSQHIHKDAEPVSSQLKQTLADGQLLRFDFGIFALHLMMTAFFVAIPLMLVGDHAIATTDHWMVYLPVLLASIVTMVPFIIVSEKKRKLKPFFLAGILTLVAANGLFLISGNIPLLFFIGLWLYFSAFNFLEASLPSLVSKTVSPESKGTALGVYSTCQFLGVFVGGVLAGQLEAHLGIQGVLVLCLVAGLAWWSIALTMKNPRYLVTRIVRVKMLDTDATRRLVAKLTSLQGVAEANVLPEEQVVYLRVDEKAFDDAALQTIDDLILEQ